MSRQCQRILVCVAVLNALALPRQSVGEDKPAVFFRGLNLNGPAVVIDGRRWEGKDAKWYRCRDKEFENQSVRLMPKTDPERARMIRSSRWGGNEVLLNDVPAGTYSLFLYVWEDNHPETFSIALNGQEVLRNFHSGQAGHWKKLGPWITEVTDGSIRLTSVGGAANFSGIEIWRGRHDGRSPAADPEEIAFFEKRIRPVLVQECLECHGSKAKKIGGSLLLDTRDGWMTGGENGPPIVPGDVAGSLLIRALHHSDDAPHMPPSKKLSDDVIADFVHWIERGAADPRDGSEWLVRKREELRSEAARRWAFQTPQDRPPPVVDQKSWPHNDVDRFILQRLESRGLKPVADADRRVLIRRVTFDLIGLPPTPDEVEDFVADLSPTAFERVVERLLMSPQYGERWGRHWLDVVRYADTAGDNSDFPIPQMFLYRNWVIEAFNRDLPFDEFVRQQLAGDLLPNTSEADRRNKIIATGYIANARRFGSRVDDYPQHLTIEDTIDNLGRAFLGLTINCARCHDHKFDPISTEDYYGLYGIFHSTRYPWPGIELEQRQRDLVSLASAEETRQAQATFAAKQAALNAAIREIEKRLPQASGVEKESLTKELDVARRSADQHRKSPLPVPQAYAVAEASLIENVRVQKQGDPRKTGAMIPRRFPESLGGQSLTKADQTSGRLSLANWIVDPHNPLTARVFVNRLWAQHFGRGLVTTPNDFGKQGKPPTHPELLDWLARRFVESGWSIKAMHRLMLLSHTYQLAAIHDPTTIPDDPANDLLRGFRPRRLEAEAIRDSLLFVSGQLDPTAGGPHPFPPMSEWKFTQHKPFKDVYDTKRRSVYLMTQRIQRHPYLALFDGPDTNASTAFRSTSTTPLKALFLLNDPFVHEQADFLAARLLREQSTDAERIDLAYRLLFGRPPADDEQSQSAAFLSAVRQQLRPDRDALDKSLESLVWQSYSRSLLRLNELVHLD